MDTYAFIDSRGKYYLRSGSFTFHRTPLVHIILNPPRMEKCITADSDLHRVVDAFLEAAVKYGGDTIAINLIKELSIMAKSKILVIDAKGKRVHAITASAEAAATSIAEAGEEGAGFKVVSTTEEFAALSQSVRVAIACTNIDVASMPVEEQLTRAYEVACKPVKVAKTPKPARAKGVKSLIRELFSIAGARHTVEEICALTAGTKVSVATAISDLRSAKYCTPGDPLPLTRLSDSKYALLSAEEKEVAEAEKEATTAQKKAEKEATTAQKKAEKEATTAQKKAEKEATPEKESRNHRQGRK